MYVVCSVRWDQTSTYFFFLNLKLFVVPSRNSSFNTLLMCTFVCKKHDQHFNQVTGKIIVYVRYENTYMITNNLINS